MVLLIMDIGDWDVPVWNRTTFQVQKFLNAEAFNQDLGDWDGSEQSSCHAKYVPQGSSFDH